MRTRLLIVAAVAVLLLAADAKDDAVKKEMDKMQGDWVAVSSERDGQKTPEDELKTMKRTVKGDGYVIMRGDQVAAKGTFKIDPTKKPAEIDALREGADKPALGIYEWDGETYRVCFAAVGKERPTEFTAKAGSGNTLSAWKKK